jgi:hypothetical protein
MGSNKMNEYFKILQEVNQSTKQLLAAEYHGLESIEIQDAAKSLQESVKPCLDELKKSALKLQQLLDTSLKTLDHAEDVWQGKQRIAEASQSIIWEQVADLTGIHFRVKKQIREHQVIILEEVENSLKEIITKCKKKYFVDKNENNIASIGWGDKDNFNKYIRYWMTDFSNEVDKKLIKLLNEDIYQLELSRLIDSSKIETYISLFDSKSTQNYRSRFDYLTKINNEKFCDTLNKIGGICEEPSIIQTLYNQATPILISWQKRFGTISWNEVSDFEKEILKHTQQRVNIILDDRREFAIKTIEESIDFYHNFIELQNRYKQETSEKQLVEKTWIDDQNQLLNRIQEQILLNRIQEQILKIV